ncbi:MAG: (2Fe-2S) ferredoxin domain-containing protein, partial [Bacteroidales bacterium]|nr:(2Fe-2S) ferredoxin domain-containing protein [Bacteroidales bacterium]
TMLEKIAKDSLPVVVTQGGCMGYCYAEPTVEVKVPGKDPVVFGHVDPKVALDIIDKYILKGELIDGILPVNYQSIQEKA